MATATTRRQARTAPKPPSGSCRWIARPAGPQLQGYLEVTTTHTAAGAVTTVYEVSRLYHPETGYPVGWELRPAVSPGLFPVPGEGYKVIDGGGCDCPAAVHNPGPCKHRVALAAALAALAR